MKKRKLFVRIVAIVLCAVMILSVATAALYVFAAEEGSLPAASPETGSPSMVWVVVAVLAAAAVIAVCIIAPKIKNKKK